MLLKLDNLMAGQGLFLYIRNREKYCIDREITNLGDKESSKNLYKGYTLPPTNKAKTTNKEHTENNVSRDMKLTTQHALPNRSKNKKAKKYQYMYLCMKS